LVFLKGRLSSLVNWDSITLCKPLVGCLLDSLERRFDDLFKDPSLRLAAIVHPQFKLDWITNGELLKRGVEKFTTEKENDEYCQTGDEATAKMDFFKGIRKRKASNENLEAEFFLKEETAETNTILKYPTLTKIFLKYNTYCVDVMIAVPSSKDIHWFGCTFSDLKFVFVSLTRKDSSVSFLNSQLVLFASILIYW